MALPAKVAKAPPLSVETICKLEGIPLSGITIMGGKPYINVTGLDCKIKNLCKEQNLILKSVRYEIIQSATKENGMRAGGWGIVELFDKDGFLEALKALNGNSGGAFNLQELKDIFTHVYKMRGYASPDTLQMATMQKPDNIEHMAERRATSRAKREATGTGLTSTDEMIGIAGSDKPPIAKPQRKSSAPKTTHLPIPNSTPLPKEPDPLDDIPEWTDDEVTQETVAEVFTEPTTEPKTDEEIRDKISALLLDMCGGDLDQIPILLTQYTTFQGDKGEVSCNDISRLKGKWLKTTYGKIKTEHEKAEREPGEEG